MKEKEKGGRYLTVFNLKTYRRKASSRIINDQEALQSRKKFQSHTALIAMARCTDDEELRELASLGQKLTHTGKKELDPKLLKKYVQLCEKSSCSMKAAFSQIMDFLEKPHAEIRYGAFMLCDHLFRTEANFREIIVGALPHLVTRSVGTDVTRPLPPPKAAAEALRQLALASLLDWRNLYGQLHIELQMAYNFLRECVKVDFNAIEKQRALEAARSVEARSKIDKAQREKLKKTLWQIKEHFTEIETCCVTLQGCLEILLPPPEEFNIPGLGDDGAAPKPTVDVSHSVEVIFSSKVPVVATVSMLGTPYATFDLRDHGMLNRNHTISFNPKMPTKIQITEDNEQVVENAIDAFRLIKKGYMSQVKAWKKVLDCHEDSVREERQAVSKLLSSLQKNVQQFNQLYLVNEEDKSGVARMYVPFETDTSDDEMEEVEEKEGYEASVGDALLADMIRQREEQRTRQVAASTSTPGSSHSSSQQSPGSSHSSSQLSPGSSHSNSQQSPGSSHSSSQLSSGSSHSSSQQSSGSSHSSSQQSPTLPSNIEAWQAKGMQQVAPYVIVNDKPDTNQVWLSAASGSQAEEAAAPQVTSIPIEFPSTTQPVKWACRAPLPSGKLCPRMDRFKCPLHGTVVPRDEQGRCSRPEDARAEEERRLLHQQQHPDWQDPKHLAELEKQTGIDLKMPVKGQRKKKPPEFPGLTDLKRKVDSPRQRLAKKLFKRK